MKIHKIPHFLLFILFAALSACSQVRTPITSNYPVTFQERGKASFYANKYQGRQTASGETFNQNSRTAAHKSFPFGTKVRVINLRNGKSVVVRINDRGPFVKGRIIDLSKSAFSVIENTRLGVTDVVVEVLQ